MNVSMIISFLILIYLGMVWQNRFNIPGRASFKSVSVKGMEFEWNMEDTLLHCKVVAPTKGWVAVGFHEKDQLAGTNLIMGAVEEDFYKMDDRYIIKPGLHKNVLELGVHEALLNKNVTEKGNSTTMQFSILLEANDSYHHHLIAGKTYYILLAYSLEDDFQHHSIMRTSVKINL